MCINLVSLSRCFFTYIANYGVATVSGKAVVPPIRITFKRIDLAILKLRLSCLKNIMV